MDKSIRVTSVDYVFNRLFSQQKFKIINLDELSRNFELDIEFKDGNYIYKNDKENFTSLRYIKKEKNESEEVYNNPPVGPIREGFRCIFCDNKGPDYHLSTCNKPTEDSLYLTYRGLLSIMYDSNYKGPLLEKITRIRQNSSEKIKFIDEYFPTATKIKEDNGRIKISLLSDSMSTISFNDVISKQGVNALPFSTNTTSFNNVIFINYSIKNDDIINEKYKNCNIRIYSNGLIDIKGAPVQPSDMNKLANELLKRILKEDDNFNHSLFSQLTNNKYGNKYTFIPEVSYQSIVYAQFYIFGTPNNDVSVNMELLQDILNKKSAENNKLFENITLTESNLTSGKFSKQGIAVRDQLVFKFTTPINNITLLINKHGAFQFTVSNNQKVALDITMKYLEKIKNVFIEISETNEISIVTNTSKVLVYDKGFNTISGLVPPKSRTQNYGTEVCRKITDTINTRPEPYTWSGKCENPNYVVGIIGKQGGDITENIDGKDQQLFFPCCSKLTAASKNQYYNYLINGYSDRSTGVFSTHDALSGVLTNQNLMPGSKTIVKTPQSTWENPELIKVQVIRRQDVKKETENTLYEVLNLFNNQLLTVKRRDFLRDTRKFRGLKQLTNQELIYILQQNNLIRNSLGRISNYDFKVKLEERKLSFADMVFRFIKIKYKVTFVPLEAVFCVFIYTQKQQYIVNSFKEIIKYSNFNVNNVNNLKLIEIYGYYHNNKFYAMFCDSQSNLNDQTNLLEQILLNNDDVSICQFYDNIIKETYNILTTRPDNKIIFTENIERNLLFTFYDNTKQNEIDVQLIDKNSSFYSLGYDDKQFINDNQITINYFIYEIQSIPSYTAMKEYIVVKPSKSANNLIFLRATTKKNFTYEEQMLKMLELTDPLTSDLIKIYKGDKIFHLNYQLIYNDGILSLIV